MLAKIAVADYMSKRIVSVMPDTDLAQAIKKLLNHKITSVPVLDERGQLVGIFSELDCMSVFLEATYNQNMGAKVDDFMTKNPVTISADTNLVDVAQKFKESAVRSFPVFEAGVFVGMISRIDVLRALVKIA